MTDLPHCTKCGSEFTYEDGDRYICPECAHEWMKDEESENTEDGSIVRDAYGNELKDGDSVTVIKDLKVKGTSSVIKVGTKVKGIRLVEEVNGHNMDVKIKGFGEVMLKSKFVKKSN